MISNAIYGFAGYVLTPDEIAFFKEMNPCGYILFQRNIENPSQVKKLTESLRSISKNDDLLILIDQEGGRVRRLKPPHFRNALPAGDFVKLFERDESAAAEAVELNHYLIGCELLGLGINVDCAPVADLKFDWAHDIVGDRSFGSSPQNVINLCQNAIDGLNASGVHEIVKHIPGHGRAMSDSHLELPRVSASLEELKQTDFAVFSGLKDSSFAMTAHILFDAIDDENCITHSIQGMNYLRSDIGFSGIIMSDDLSMEALKGTIQDRAQKAMLAGNDILLHCNGKMDEMQQVAKHAGAFSKLTDLKRLNHDLKIAVAHNKFSGADSAELEVRLQALLSKVYNIAS